MSWLSQRWLTLPQTWMMLLHLSWKQFTVLSQSLSIRWTSSLKKLQKRSQACKISQSSITRAGNQITKCLNVITRTPPVTTATSKGIWNPHVIRSRKEPTQFNDPQTDCKRIDVVKVVPAHHDNLPKLEVPVEIQGQRCLMEIDTATTGNVITNSY